MICYKCNKLGHIKFECLKLKKSFKKDRKYKKEKRQALKATLDDSSQSSDDDTNEKITNLYFIALEEPSSDEVTLDFESNDEILLACEKLVHKCDKYLFRINSLKEMVKTLEEELEKSRSSNEQLTNSLNENNSKKIDIANENAELSERNVFLEKENGNLKESISRFNKGQEILDGMIPMTSTPLKSKNEIIFENAHASSSMIVNSSNPITKICQRPSLRTNEPKRSNENKTNHSRASSSIRLKPRKYNHAHSHGFHNFKIKEHAQNFRCHYCGVMGHKNSRCYIRKTHLSYTNDESFNANSQGPKYI